MDPDGGIAMNLILIGFMGVGKTCVGKGAAQRLGWSFIDTDTLIEEARSMTIPEIFAKHGNTSFRKTEKAVVESVARSHRCVIATGGGVVLDPENVDRLRRHGFLIHLTLSPDIIFDRIGHQSDRPLLQTDNPRETLEALFQSRESLYRACSDFTIDRNGLNVNETVEKMIEAIGLHGIIENPQSHWVQRR